jgi:hypothetical protein
VVGALATAAPASCKPNLNDTVSIVTTPRVLAVRSENDAGQAEFAVLQRFEMTALYVDGSGLISPSPLQWAFCIAPKPLAELGPVSPLCLDFGGDAFTPLGVGNQVAGTMPMDACQLFGHDQGAAASQRPVDPDTTGGYYQPVQVLAPGGSGPMLTIGETRIACTLASPSQDVRNAFAAQYLPNVNPTIASLGVKGDSAPWSPTSDGNAQPNRVAPGAHVALEVAWPSCPPPAAGAGAGTDAGTGGHPYAPCAGAEHYLALDPASQTLVDRREAIAVAWYATSGAFDVDRSGRAGDDPVTATGNGWQAPSAGGSAIMWVVLRDERGGVGWEQYAIDIR